MFEQLFILWGLPLILIPLIVHLLNRLRFKSLDWAAMSFLLSASKESTKHQKLKQFLILLFRILALLCLIFALSRPKVGGLLAMTFSSPPDTILVLFDRSQSMENIDSHSSKTQRNIALEKLINTIREVPGSPRIILIDSLLKEAVEIDDAELLSKHPYLQKTNSSADWPSIMQSAWQYLTDNESGKTEIWISTDLQSASWKKESKRWETILEQFKELKKVTEIKFISQSLATNKNQGIEILDVKLFEKNKALFLELSFALHKNYQETKTLPMRVNIANDELKTFDIELSTERQIFRQQFEIENRNATWGTITLPNDGNLADNKAYFVFEEESAQKISIVSDNPGNARVLQLLSAPPISMNEASTFLKADLSRALESKPALLIIEGLVGPNQSKEIKDFLEGGGVILALPDMLNEGAFLDYFKWGEQQIEDTVFHVQFWNQQDGPLADTSEGTPLALANLKIKQRQRIYSKGESIADYADNSSFLKQLPVGRGTIYILSTNIHKDSSNLNNGLVILPFIQRLIRQGKAQFSKRSIHETASRDFEFPDSWRSLSTDSADIRRSAGVYQNESMMVAQNPATSEFESQLLSENELHLLFKGLPVEIDSHKAGKENQSPQEIWRIFFIGVLMFMFLESLLTLPSKRREIIES